MTDIRDLHAGWMIDPVYRREYDALESEFALATVLIRARADAGLTQEELAFEAKIDLTYVGGIERGKRNPSLLVMARIAQALSAPLAKLINE